MRFTIFVGILFFSTIETLAGTACVDPSRVSASHETVWASKNHTGAQRFAIDQDPKTQWTTEILPSTVEFFLPEKREIIGFLPQIAGSVNPFNMLNVEVNGKVVLASVHQTGGNPIFLPKPVVTNSIKLTLLKERDPVDQNMPTWGGFAEFQFVIPSDADANCVKPIATLGGPEGVTNKRPNPDITTREIIDLVLTSLPLVAGIMVLCVFVWLFTRNFQIFLETVSKEALIVMLAVMAGIASAVFLGQVSISGSFNKLSVTAGGGFAVFVLVLIVGLRSGHETKPNSREADRDGDDM